MKRIALLTAILLVALSAIAAPGRPSGPPPQQGPQQGPPPGGDLLPPGALAEFLALTDAQKEAGAALRATLESTIQPLHEQQRVFREQIDAAVAAGDATRAGQLLLASHGLREQIRAAHESFASAFRALLTNEQRAKFDVYQELLELRRR